MTALRWWWVRHAPTGAPGVIGWTDAPADLSDRAALDALAAALPHAPVVSSDLSRAVATADRIAGLRPRLGAEPALREMRFGAWEGLPAAAIAERWPEESRRFWAEPGAHAAPDGESFDDLAARVGAAVEGLNARLGSGDVIAVAHMGVVMAALARALGLSARQAMAFRIDTLSVTRLDWLPDARAWRVEAVNRRYGASG
ncbi:MAG: histidine phosphatase family protein [Rhodobacteraceae bacterium]|nr:MAG: histidine phosphatase family protein [Paracoccaceae bacterium]